jgi:hypothetical protein
MEELRDVARRGNCRRQLINPDPCFPEGRRLRSALSLPLVSSLFSNRGPK